MSRGSKYSSYRSDAHAIPLRRFKGAFGFHRRVGSEIIFCILLLWGCKAGSSENPLLPALQVSLDAWFTHPESISTSQERMRIEQRIVRWINEAQDSVLIMAYGLNSRPILRALERAQRRKVKIQIILSPEKDYPALKGRKLPIYYRKPGGLQHLKCMVIDANRMIAGTGNFTRSGLYFNNNAFLFFELPAAVAHRIRQRLLEPDDRRPFIRIGPHRMVLSPEGGRLIQTIIAQRIFSAGHSIRFMTFRFTDATLAQLLLAAGARGIPVSGIIDGDWPSLPAREALEDLYYSSGELPIRLYHDGNENQYVAGDGIYHGGHMHHKTAIVDNVVLTGSYNWSKSARDQNREGFFVLRSMNTTEQFSREFERQRSLALPLARPPFLEIKKNPEPEPIAVSPPSYCLASEAVAVSGAGPFFHALHLTTSSHRCSGGKESNTGQYSAGASKGRDYFPAHRGMQTLIWNKGHSRATQNGPRFPCSHGGCQAAQIHRINLSQGWLFADGIPSKSEMLLLGRDGWQSRQIRQVAPGFYRFSPLPQQDMLLFLGGTNTEYGCAVAGAMDPEIRRYLAFLEYWDNAPIRCLNDEG